MAETRRDDEDSTLSTARRSNIVMAVLGKSYPFQKIVLASNNAGKLKEFSALLNDFHIEVIPQNKLAIPEADEPYFTFIENAIGKARHASKLSKLPALADDSGLCVRALNGEPGVYSARYAFLNGKEKTATANNIYLLEKLKSYSDKRAYFYCILVFITHEKDPQPLIAEGRIEGEIISTPRGENGFGYDPVFYLPNLDKTMAELEPEIKNTVSHRARALKALRLLMEEKYFK